MKRFVQIILCVLVFAFMTGCGGSSNHEIDMTRLKNEVGEYQYSDLAWGSSRSQVEDYIGRTMEYMGTAQGHELFLAESALEWNGVDANFMCEFAQDKLDCVAIKFKPEEGRQEELWNELLEIITNTYGGVEPTVLTGEAEVPQELTTYFWETTVDKRTAMTLKKSSSGGVIKSITMDVYVIPAEKTQ